MTAEQKIRYTEYYQNVMLTGAAGFKFLEPAKEFDEFGLKHPSDYLKQISANIILLPLEFMAEYVDLITKTAIDENDKAIIIEANEQLKILNKMTLDDLIERVLNATSIGNMAYVALNCKDEEVKKNTEEMLNRIFKIQSDYLMSQLSNIVRNIEQMEQKILNN